MDVTAMRTRISALVGDENKIQFSDTILLMYINDAVKALAADLGFNRNSAVFTTLDNVSTEVSGGVLLPADFMQVMNVFWNNTRINRVPNSVVFASQLQVAASSTTPNFYHVQPMTSVAGVSNMRMLFYPHLSKLLSGFSCKVEYASRPADLTTGTDIPGIPDFTHEAIVLYALSKCYLQDGDLPASRFVMDDYNSKVMMYRSILSSEIYEFGEVSDGEESLSYNY